MSVSGLLITHQPQSQAVSEGDNVLLECKAEANPPAQYKWYHNMVPMEQEKKRLLQVSGLLLYRVEQNHKAFLFRIRTLFIGSGGP